MADGVDITPGSGAKVWTDDLGAAGHVQGVKLLDGTDDSENRAIVNTSGQLLTLNTPVRGSATGSQVSVTTSATALVAANSSRKRLLIVNHGSVTVFVGPSSGVTAATGLPLPPGQALEDDTSTSGWWGIVASGTADVRMVEVA